MLFSLYGICERREIINKTLYIPLYGKALVSRKGIILQDTKAEEIWAAEGFPLGGRSRSKWLAYTMGMRSAVFDAWVKQQLEEIPGAAVLHIGCGLDSRCLRVGADCPWYDVDFPDVIAERRRFYEETEHYRMLGADARDAAWLEDVPPCENAVVVLEGISMYLRREELQALLHRLCGHFGTVRVLADFYTEFAAKASKYKNPINDVGVTQVYGMDDPQVLTGETGLAFVREHDMAPAELAGQLRGGERFIFKLVYGGRMAKKLYRLYEYRSKQ